MTSAAGTGQLSRRETRLPAVAGAGAREKHEFASCDEVVSDLYRAHALSMIRVVVLPAGDQPTAEDVVRRPGDERRIAARRRGRAARRARLPARPAALGPAAFPPGAALLARYLLLAARRRLDPPGLGRTAWIQPTHRRGTG
jgi:hypothetical protein